MKGITNLFKKAVNKLNEMITGTMAGAAAKAEEIRDDNRGASDLVAVVVIIIVILGVAVVFRQTLANAIAAIGNRLTDWINSN